MSRPRSPTDRRRRVLFVSAIVLIVTLGAFVTSTAAISAGHPRGVDLVRTAGFAMLTLVIAVRATTSFTLLKRDSALDDELTRANRAGAAFAGFWAMIVGLWAALAAALFINVTVLEAAPVIIAMGAAAAAVRFSRLEALGDGPE